MDSQIAQAIINFVAVDSIGSIIIRAVVWLVLVTIVAAGTAQGKKMSRVKAEAGFFLFFIFMSGLSIYLMFGIIPTISSKPATYLIPGYLLALIPGVKSLLKKTASDFLQTLG